MKRWYHLVGALVVLAGLVIFLEYDHKQEEAQQKKTEAEAMLLQGYPWAALNQIDISTTLANVVLVPESTPAKDTLPSEWSWKLTKPLDTEAQVSDIQAILRLLKSLKQLDTIEENATDLSIFGLDTKQSKPITIRLHSPQKTLEIAIGRLNPDSTGNYARLNQSAKVLLIEQGLNYLSPKDDNFFRRKDILSFENSDVEKIHYRWQKDGETQLQRQERHWQLLQPFATAADDSNINSFLSDLKALRVDGYVSENGDQEQAKYGFTQPRASITLDLGKDDKATQVKLLIGNDNSAKTAFYLRRSGSPTIYQAPSYMLDKAKRTLSYFVDHDLSHFVVADIHSIQIESKNIKSMILELDQGKWQNKDKAVPINSDKVKEILDQLITLRATDYLGRKPTPQQHLDKPTLQITLSGPLVDGKPSSMHEYRFAYRLDKKASNPSQREQVFVQGGADNLVFSMDHQLYLNILDNVDSLLTIHNAEKDKDELHEPSQQQ